MGYTLTIGEAVLYYDEDDCRITCESVRLDNAPAFGDPTDFTSSRWPSYSAWADAMRKLDLMDVMFNERNHGSGEFEWNGVSRSPLISSHPGCTPITKEHVEYVADRMEKYKAAHPTHRPEYPPPKPGAQPIVPGSSFYAEDDYVKDPEFDGALCRGEWLLFWLVWAVDNCERPVFVNS